jgi:pimeloyl-ACP methyl ester carboxylesterase
VDSLLAQWQSAGREFRHEGRSLFYRDEGTGPVLLCLHGYPTASWDWHRVWPRLVKRYRLIAMDMLGFGFSDKPRDVAYTIAGQATLHERLLASLGVGEVHVLAHDYGGTVAQELMARYQERFQKGQAGVQLRTVSLLNGGLFPESHRARPIQTLLRSPLGPLLVRLLDERAFRRSFCAIFGADTQPDDAELSRCWDLINHNEGRLNMGRLLHYIDERKRHRQRWVGALVEASMPVQFIVGMDDPVSGAHMAQRYRELLPQGKVVELAGIGHYPQWEATDRVVDAVDAFVNRPVQQGE